MIDACTADDVPYTAHCEWCEQPFTHHHAGTVRRFCGRACQVTAYRLERAARESEQRA